MSFFPGNCTQCYAGLSKKCPLQCVIVCVCVSMCVCLCLYALVRACMCVTLCVSVCVCVCVCVWSCLSGQSISARNNIGHFFPPVFWQPWHTHTHTHTHTLSHTHSKTHAHNCGLLAATIWCVLLDVDILLVKLTRVSLKTCVTHCTHCKQQNPAEVRVKISIFRILGSGHQWVNLIDWVI